MIKFKNTNFSYENCNDKNINNLNLHIKKGECIVFTGRSGEGKTSMIRLINGLIPSFFSGTLSGEIEYFDKKPENTSINEISKDIGSVFQDPRSQFFCTDVLSELAFTCENYGISKNIINQKIDESVKIININSLLNKKIFELSSGEKQKVAIASILVHSPKIIVLDEPSSNLDYISINKLKKILEDLKFNGFTLIISEHRLYYLKDIFDKFYYIEKGKIVEEFCCNKISKLSCEDFVKRGLRKLNIEYKRNSNRFIPQNNDVLVSIKNLNFNFKKNSSLICNINLKLKKGEIIALLGHNGAGKTTFAKILAGLIKEISGEIYFEKEKVNIKKRLKYTSLVLQDPDYQLFSESVENEFKLGKYSKNFNNEELDIILEKLDLLKFKNRHPSTLSGGQKQRLTIALSIVKDSKLVIMDEPTSGLDYTNMMKIVDILNDMKNKGKSIIVITHDFEFLLNACDRVIHLKKGKIDNDLYLTENNFNEIKKIYEEDINEKEGV